MNDNPEIEKNSQKLEKSFFKKFLNKITDTEEIYDQITNFSWVIFSIGLLTSLLVVGYGIVMWLRYGEWITIPISILFMWLNLDPFTLINNIEWQGIIKIYVWFLELPLSVGVLILGIVLGYLFSVISRTILFICNELIFRLCFTK